MFRNFAFLSVVLNCIIFWKLGFSVELKAIHSNELTTPVIEYYFEHEVTEKDARKVIADFVENGKSAKRPPYCDECTTDDKHYCNSRAFISDHCCCDHRHAKEKLPWVPHTCYLAKGPCVPHYNSCMKYQTIKECCCDKILLDKWRHTFSHSASIHRHQIWKISTHLPIIIAIIISSHSILFATRLR